MKLRIKGNTIRLRLTKGEVATFANEGRVQDAIAFGTASKLVYALSQSKEGDHLSVTMEERQIKVVVPAALATRWVGTEEVSMQYETASIDGTPPVHILVEKDFQCLHKRPMEDESDNYEHPQQHN